MILPTRHLSTNASLLAIGALVLDRLGGGSSRSVSELWSDLRDENGVVTFDRFCLAMTLLYVLGVVENQGGRVTRLRR